ncbi:hypothetical protein [Undibacterium sp. RuTC16W]|uniref:hypothetical protein n=1 Tax=Undibacterium sp. RuTC16W TaxID=3413048 RepID=UPI003BF1CB20
MASWTVLQKPDCIRLRGEPLTAYELAYLRRTRPRPVTRRAQVRIPSRHGSNFYACVGDSAVSAAGITAAGADDLVAGGVAVIEGAVIFSVAFNTEFRTGSNVAKRLTEKVVRVIILSKDTQISVTMAFGLAQIDHNELGNHLLQEPTEHCIAADRAGSSYDGIAYLICTWRWSK